MKYVLARLHQHAPLIHDWCGWCKAYTAHANGSTENRTTATQCRRCGALMFWP